MTGVNNITLHLTEAQHLFAPPDVLPLSPEWRNVSGVELIYQQWLVDKRAQPGRLTLHLASPGDADRLSAQIQAALHRYSQQEIEHNEFEIKLIRQMARKTSVIGLTILASFLVSAVVVEWLTWLPVWLATLLHESFVIAGWVALWWPAELIFYEWWPYKSKIDFLHYLAALEIEVKLTTEIR